VEIKKDSKKNPGKMPGAVESFIFEGVLLLVAN